MLMRKLRMSLVASVGLLALLVAGCAAEARSCPRIDGEFSALYTPRSGTCGPITNPFPIPFPNDPATDVTIMRTTNNAKVTTEIVNKGCTVRMSQTVMPTTGAGLARIDGDVAVQNQNQLSGVVTLTQFDNAGQPACSGEYDAQLMKSSITSGGAASSSLGGAAQ